MPALHEAIKVTRLDVVRLLLEYGDNIERQDHHQFTPLLYSIWQEKLEACRLLLEFGANVDAWKTGDLLFGGKERIVSLSNYF